MISRRNFIKFTVTLLSIYPFRKVLAYPKEERSLNLFNIHTREKLFIKYFKSGIYDKNALNDLNYLLRCHYSNEIINIDISLLNLLCDIKDVFGKDREIHIISGYRSFAYNEYLRSIGRKVVRDSLHLYGLAIDFTIPGISSSELSDVAKSFSVGGVGKYTEFIHIDVGRIRYW